MPSVYVHYLMFILLAQEQGVEFIIHGVPKMMYGGTLAIVSGDNLGSLALGGFKESCSALKICRHCVATKDESQKQVWLKHV